MIVIIYKKPGALSETKDSQSDIRHMDKIIYIAPHLSTGGMPQYLVRQIESMMHEYEVHVVEWADVTGGQYVVQRNRIRNLVGERFYTLGEDKSELIEIMDRVGPIAIHFHEIPETFVSRTLLNALYDEDRGYRIVVTTHSSTTNPERLQYTADKFVLVSEWSKDVFESFFGSEIPLEIWEYPIDSIEKDPAEAKRKLGFDPTFKHVLCVGLFTRGKNQGELFDLAKTMQREKVLFHFVGNQAVNFKDYWEPIMAGKPSNCIIHGERSDVGLFYEAADLFYFPSNFELNPLAVKEALSYGLPTFIKRLHTYKETYDGIVTYISSDQEKNRKALIEKIGGLESKTDFSRFDWGSDSEEARQFVTKSILQENSYEKMFHVEEGDVVVDAGARRGAFSYSILHKNPGRLICLEDDPEEFSSLEKNIGERGELVNDKIGRYEEKGELTLENMADQMRIGQIDFLKLDCGGGEYSIFSIANEDFILERVRKAAGIWYLGSPELKEKFKEFRNNYLTLIDDYHIFSIDGVDIKWEIWTDRFVEYYSEVYIYIDNRKERHV